MTSLSHSPVTFTWNFASSTSGSDFLRSSHSGAISVPLKSLGPVGFVISRRDFTVSVKVRKGKKRHVYPWDDVPDLQTDGELCRAIHPFKPLKEKPKPVILEFEKPLIAARKKIMEVKKLVNESGLDLSGAMISRENKLQKESLGGAHTDPHWTSQQIKSAILKSMDELTKMDEGELLKHRQLKFKKMGWVREGVPNPIDPFKKRILDLALHTSNEISVEKNLSEDEEIIEEYGNEEVDEDFFVESADEATKKRIEEFEQEIKILEAWRKDAESTKKKIEELDWDALSPSQIEAIEGVKKEYEEMERGTLIRERMYKEMIELAKNIEAIKFETPERKTTKFETKRFEEFLLELSRFISETRKDIDSMEKKIEKLDWDALSPSQIEAIEGVKKDIEEMERGILIREELYKDIKKFLEGIEETERSTENEAMEKEIEELERRKVRKKRVEGIVKVGEENEESEELKRGVVDMYVHKGMMRWRRNLMRGAIWRGLWRP